MPKSKKKRNKPYRPRPLDKSSLAADLTRVNFIMQPFDELIDGLENRGTVDMIDNVIIFHDRFSDERYPLIPAAKGFLDVFDIWERRKGAECNMTPLHQLIARLEYGAPITELELASAKEALMRMRKVIRTMTIDEMYELTEDAEIKIMLEKRWLTDKRKEKLA